MIDRRTAVKLAALGVAAQQFGWAQYKLQFFTPAENAVLDALAETVLPADEHSPGARAAKVSLYIDLIAANGNPETQSRWRSGLTAFNAAARRSSGASFDALPSARQNEFIKNLAQSPAAERFFADVRHATVFAYYTSRIGLIDELGYKGNQAMGHFAGCATLLP